VYELLSANPWLFLATLTAVVIVACVGIVFGIDYLRKARQAELDAILKQLMLERGMSAADIKTVLEASSSAEELRLALGEQGVRFGFGKLRLEMGALAKPAEKPSPPASFFTKETAEHKG
jgi:hypothetical protein